MKACGTGEGVNPSSNTTFKSNSHRGTQWNSKHRLSSSCKSWVVPIEEALEACSALGCVWDWSRNQCTLSTKGTLRTNNYCLVCARIRGQMRVTIIAKGTQNCNVTF